MQTHTPELENIIYLQRTHKVKNNVPELTLGDEKTSKDFVEFVLCWPSIAERGACPYECFVSPMGLSQRKLIFHLQVVIDRRQLLG